MMHKAKMIDGRKIAHEIQTEIISESKRFIQDSGISPKLAVVLLGRDPASLFYVRMIERACKKVGFHFEKHELSEKISESEVLDHINRLNNDKAIHGIIVQAPLPDHIKQENIQMAVNPIKDVDCFNPVNMGRIMMGKPRFLPCTPYAVFELLKRESIQVEGKHVVIVGRSNIVGKPLAMILLLKQNNANATVTVCHSRTPNLSYFTKKGDIVIAAAGKAKLITAEMIREGSIVIDVGTNELEGQLVGDVDFADAEKVAASITPVPGGVGPITNVMLMRNTLQAARYQKKMH